MESVTCRNCGRECDPSEEHCTNCGFPLPRLVAGPTLEPTAIPIDPNLATEEVGDPFAQTQHRATIVIEGSREIQLGSGDRLVIGRDPDTPLAEVCGDNISRRHAEVYVNDGGVFIEDLDSTNGTTVDGERIKPHDPCQLLSTATVRLGSSPPLRMTISVGGAS